MPEKPSQNALQHIYKLFYDDLALCGCGSPEPAVFLVQDILEMAPFHERTYDEIAQLIGTEGACHMVLSMLDRADLIEHGANIGGSWLTDKGTWCLQTLRQIDHWSLFDEAGLPHDGGPCTDACWQTT